MIPQPPRDLRSGLVEVTTTGADLLLRTNTAGETYILKLSRWQAGELFEVLRSRLEIVLPQVPERVPRSARDGWLATGQDGADLLVDVRLDRMSFNARITRFNEYRIFGLLSMCLRVRLPDAVRMNIHGMKILTMVPH